MQCLQDYIKESKNKSFEELAFNELDGAVLSMLVLLDVAKCAPKVHRKGITFEEYITRYVTLHGTKYVGLLIPPALIRLLSRAKTGSRFKNLIIVDGFSKISDKEETQSTFLSVILPDKTRVVLFGSTDDTVVGWQEDFNLLCSSHVPCLDYAVKYVNDVCKKSEKLIFMGHSKGGFESLYSCAYCDEEIYQKIIKAYSFDGPGYSIDIISDKQFIRALDKMVLVVPNGGIVGRLFYNPIEPNIVPSKYRGLIQHDILSWEVKNNAFKRCNSFTKTSNKFKLKIDNWMLSISNEEKLDYVKCLVDVLRAGGASTLTQVKEKPYRSLVQYLKLTKKEKKLVLSLFKLLAKDKLISKEIFLGFATIVFSK